ncbi:MAG TPA: hypothetical protein VI564_05535 [Candidatus Nanoarchaeia archaeon]|nr:hypothetical protein [Candidatus Nanoarchaeia archaeon]
MPNRTNKRTSKRSVISASIRNNILKILSESDKPVSTQEIGTKIGRAWHSIQNYCLKLQLEDKITGFRVGNMNLWILKVKESKK